jgi:adenine/guanine phosphoribosyltransferase-like PRPP-binding protein
LSSPPSSAPREGEPYDVELPGFRRSVALRRAGPTLIAYLDFLNDRPLVRACADLLAQRLAEFDDVDVLVAPEAGAIPLCFLVAERLDLPHVVARKRSRDYVPMAALSVPVQSITALKPEILVLDADAAARLKGRRVALLDTVISTGSTMGAVEQLAGMAGAHVTRRVVAFTEGDTRSGDERLVSLGALPVFPASAAAAAGADASA